MHDIPVLGWGGHESGSQPAPPPSSVGAQLNLSTGRSGVEDCTHLLILEAAQAAAGSAGEAGDSPSQPRAEP